MRAIISVADDVAGASAKPQPATSPVRIISDRQDVNKAISKTAAAMRDHVLQPLARHLTGTEYQVDEWQQVEGVASDLATSLDRQGVDWMGLRRSGRSGIFSVPIASRVQNLDFWTFTIRRQLPSGGDTEWHRLCRRAERGWKADVGPVLFVQAYMSESGGELMRWAAVTCERLYEVALRECDVDNQRNWLRAPGGNWFLKVPWGRFGDYYGTEFWTEHYPVGPRGQGALL